MKKTIYFFYKDVKPNFRERTKVKRFLANIFSKEKMQLETLNYIFCSDQELLSINQQFLMHDFYTDIISFDLSVDSKGVSGEIYISIDRVKDNAKENGVSFKNELLRVIFHGALHLCGFKDKKKSEKEQMTIKEDYYLNKFQKFVPRET